MSKHSRNNTASSVFTHYERQKHKYGTQKERLGRDSLLPFDACAVCLKQLVVPMACPKGHMFCKECILTSLLKQRKANKTQQALYDAQKKREELAEAEEKRDKELKELEEFQKNEVTLLLHRQKDTKPTVPKGYVATKTAMGTVLMPDPKAKPGDKRDPAPAIKAEKNDQRILPSFWIPSLTPAAAPDTVKAPPKFPTCPESDHPLRAKHLIQLQFKAPNNVAEGEQQGSDRFACPACNKLLSLGTKASALKSCGHVFCRVCVKNFVLSSGTCSVCNEAVGKDDIVHLRAGGTGFASHGDKLEAKKYAPAMVV